MSLEATRHAWAIRGLTSTQKFVLLRIADRANETGVCWPSPEDLAADTGFTDRAVRGALVELERVGLIQRGKVESLRAIRYIFAEPDSENRNDVPKNGTMFQKAEPDSGFKPRATPPKTERGSRKRKQVPDSRKQVPEFRNDVPEKWNDVPRSILEESTNESTREPTNESVAGGSETSPAQQSLIPVGPGSAQPAKPRRSKNDPTLATLIWRAYSAAYEASPRYGTKPVWNKTVAGQVTLLGQRLGRDAPDVATFFVGHPAAFYAQRGHTVGLLLADAEKLHGEWKRGQHINAEQARRQERTEANPFLRMAAEKLREERSGVIDHEE